MSCHGSNASPKVALPSVTPKPLREVLALPDLRSVEPGTCAIQAVKAQVENHETRRNARVRTTQDDHGDGVPSLFDVAAKKLADCVGGDTEEDEKFLKAVESLPPNVLARIALMLDIPYDMFCKARQSAGREDSKDVDEWVLRNEIWLREPPILHEEESQAAPSKRFHWDEGTDIQGPRQSDWRRGIVRLSKHADVVFSGSQLTDTCRIITRPTSLPGLKLLDGRRPPAILIQPSVELFAKTFETMTGGLLKGLHWDNIFIAGGIILGALLCTEDKDATNTPDQWKNSDVDMYIYGLSPVEANKKIEHIFDVFKSNLPQDAPVLVVRNSKTITFFSSYPLRRIQVVLKLVDSPKDVLLNFDLDICAIGWDGKEVWMLPRAARALETGYTVFTMDLINGHYLGDRRATQEERVFKYADKGYGIRILPSYLKEFEAIMHDTSRRETLGGNLDQADDNASIGDIIFKARLWTARAVTKIRNYQKDLLKYRRRLEIPNSFVPTISHAWLQERYHGTDEPQRRSALMGLTLFMRHVALWEHEVIGNAIIEKNTWASPVYDAVYASHFGVGYNDIPDYSWNETFTIDGFIASLAEFNKKEDIVLEHVTKSRWRLSPPHSGISTSILAEDIALEHVTKSQCRRSKPHSGAMDPPKSIRTQRVAYAPTVQEILQPEHDIYLPVWLPQSFIGFANEVIPKAVRESGVSHYTARALVPASNDGAPIHDLEDGSLELMFWHTNSLTMWQQLSRIIDEVHEALWSFHHANAGVGSVPSEERTALLFKQLARRAVRMTTQDEYGAFALWATDDPMDFYNRYDEVPRLLRQRDALYDDSDEFSEEEYSVPGAPDDSENEGDEGEDKLGE